MKFIRLYTMLTLLVFIGSCSGHDPAQNTPPSNQQQTLNEKRKQPSFVPGEILVQFRAATDNQTIESIQREMNLQTVRLIRKPDLFLMKITDGADIEKVIEKLNRHNAVIHAEPNYIRHIKRQ